MSVKLLKSIDESAFSNPADRKSFFGKKDSDYIQDTFEIPREIRAIGVPGKSCDVNLFLGFFFDGTRNNYDASSNAGNYTHSNVARLYGAYPGQHVPGVPAAPEAEWTTDKDDYKNFFKVYVPGVGTPFTKIGDSGKGMDETAGAGTGLYAERRIIWALVQALNCIHRYLAKSDVPTLFLPDETLEICKNFDLGQAGLLEVDSALKMNKGQRKWGVIPKGPTDAKGSYLSFGNTGILTSMLQKLHAAIKPHMKDKKTGTCSKVDPGRVQNIYVSTFGFSRGAAEARVFANWFLRMCEIDAELLGEPGPTLGTFPVTFDFLGLFDTVASVGLAASSLFHDGHGAWADAEVSMRIPEKVKCLHIVAAHELRRSFPSDSIHVGNTLPSTSDEWVCPGVHSDIGGGYTPKEQGKGTDATGADMLSRIPLAVMYHAARMAGAPLKLEKARPAIQKQFLIDKGLIKDFNDYLAVCKVKEGALRDIMDEQRKLYILWRKSWAGLADAQKFVQRASAEDRADLKSADEAFVTEVKDFEAWRKKKKTTGAFKGSVDNVPGIDSERVGDWQRIEAYWNEPAPTRKLFDDRVHDSHAWFKLTSAEAREFKKTMNKLVAQKRKEEAAPPSPASVRYGGDVTLTHRQREWVRLYETKGEYATDFSPGREDYWLGAGYLRYRRVYAGADQIRLTQSSPTDTQPGMDAETHETVLADASGAGEQAGAGVASIG